MSFTESISFLYRNFYTFQPIFQKKRLTLYLKQKKMEILSVIETHYMEWCYTGGEVKLRTTNHIQAKTCFPSLKFQHVFQNNSLLYQLSLI